MNPLARYQGSRFGAALFVVHCARWAVEDAAEATGRNLAALGLGAAGLVVGAGLVVTAAVMRLPSRRRR